LIDLTFHNAASALNEAYRRERAVVDNAVDVICSVDLGGNFSKVSQASEKLWGMAPEELIERPWTDVVFRDDIERSVRWFELLKSAEQSSELENRVLRKNGTLVHMLWSSHWSSEEKSMFCVAHDITDRVELERLKKQFVEMISHDLRTPLSAVNSTLELLGTGTWGELSTQGQNKVEAAEENLRHSIDLINNLLDLDKMESGTMDLNLKQISLAQLLRKCGDSVASLAEQRSIEISQPERDEAVMADERRISQVVINLLGNALKFTPHGSTIGLDLVDDEEFVKVTVSDEGSGIPESQRKLIFERFHQVPESEKKSQGTGLGLAICKAIVTAHGGTIGVDSELGKGSTFWFKLKKLSL
jgi:PAS domain S-box-containing protein